MATDGEIVNTHADLSTRHPAAKRAVHSSSPSFLTPRDVAKITGLHVAVIRRAIDRGELRAHKLCSRLRIRQEDFEIWLHSNIVQR
jgi:excisionase family DNA binding protein